jgi:hypothetical protein
MANNSNRDEFTPATKRAIERQARGHCSNPACRRLTRGATADGGGEVNIGVASHISAAAPGGPRYDKNMAPHERRSVDNGIWLCDVHARAVDAKNSKFIAEQLRAWKKRTNEDSWRSIMQNIPYGPAMRVRVPDCLKGRLTARALANFLEYAPSSRHVIIAENRIDCPALSTHENTLAILGMASDIDSLSSIPWLADQPLHFWGDLDPQGFAMLSRLRTHFPELRSFLMDWDTLLEHRRFWTLESKFTKVLRSLEGLNSQEQRVYEALRLDCLGDSVRLRSCSRDPNPIFRRQWSVGAKEGRRDSYPNSSMP